MMMRLLPMLLLMLCFRPAEAQALQWAKQIGDSADQELTDFKVDKDGSLILFGRYSSYPEAGSRPSLSPGHYSLFLHKLDSVGNTLWFRHLGSPYKDWALGMDIDPEGNIYVLGSMAEYPYDCRRDCILSSIGPDTVRLDTAGGGTFVARYSPAGKVEWVRQFQRRTSFHLTLNPEMTIQNGKVYLFGFFRGELGFLGHPLRIGNPRTGNLGFLARLDVDGSPRWLDTLVGPEYVAAVEEDASGGLYLGYQLGASNQEIEKRDSTGRTLWRKEIFSPSGTTGSYLGSFIRDEAGSLYVTGGFSYQAVFRLDDGTDSTATTPFSREIFLEKLNPDGSIAWFKAGKSGGMIRTGAPLPGGGVLFSRTGSSHLYRLRANGSLDSLPQLSLHRIHLLRDGRTLVAASTLAGTTPTVLGGRTFVSAGKQDILVVRLDLEAPTMVRRPVPSSSMPTAGLRYSPLGRILPGNGPDPVPAFGKRVGRPAQWHNPAATLE
jgi:hypothetical protein